MQMYNSPYKKLADCIASVYRTEGVTAFYRSYTTQLAMNLPFQVYKRDPAICFNTETDSDSREYLSNIFKTYCKFLALVEVQLS